MRIFLLFFSLISVTSAQSAIDAPIKGRTFGTIVDEFHAISAHMSADDRFLFSVGFTRLCAVFTHEFEDKLSEEERHQIAAAAIHGMTPRQIILVGQAVSVLTNRLYNKPIAAELTATAEGSALRAYRRFGKEANKALEPTPTSVTSPAAQEPRQP